MRYLICTLMFLLVTSTAFAAEEEVVEKKPDTSYEDALLKDWHGLIKVLRSHGVHNSQVHWRSIEELCLGLKSARDTVPYNRCRLDKSIAQVTYRNDDAECDQEAEATYPDRLIQFRPEVIIAGNEVEKGEATEFTNENIIRAPISRRELYNKRAVIYRSCMRELGWRDPDNWRLGKKD